MKLSKKEALVITMLAIVGIYQLCSWAVQLYRALEPTEYNQRMNTRDF